MSTIFALCVAAGSGALALCVTISMCPQPLPCVLLQSVVPLPYLLSLAVSMCPHLLTLCAVLQSVVPCRFRADKQLVSHDTKSNTYNFKYTFSVEIAPVCKVCACVLQASGQLLKLLQIDLWHTCMTSGKSCVGDASCIS